MAYRRTQPADSAICRHPTQGAPPSQQGKLPSGAHRAGGPRLMQPRPVSFREEVKAPKGFRTSPIPPSSEAETTNKSGTVTPGLAAPLTSLSCWGAGGSGRHRLASPGQGTRSRAERTEAKAPSTAGWGCQQHVVAAPMGNGILGHGESGDEPTAPTSAQDSRERLTRGPGSRWGKSGWQRAWWSPPAEP